MSQRPSALAGAGDSNDAGSPHRTKLPTIPDLRFEYSYLKSIKPFVKITRVAGRTPGGGSPREVIQIEWGRVLWVTLKDQVFSPFMQGTVWGFATWYLKPLVMRLGFKGIKSIARRPKKDGEGVSRLRNFWQGLGLRSHVQSS